MSYSLADLPERIASKIAVADSGCWQWTASISVDGYGRTTVNRRTAGAHRACYEILVGSIPVHLVIDHLCRNRRCVNPEHLEPVTRRENTLRGETNAAANAAKTHCHNGHGFTIENTRIDPQGKRVCIECHRERTRQNMRALRARRRSWQITPAGLEAARSTAA